MSSNLYWKPADEYGERLPSELKMALRKRYGDPIDARLSNDDVPYLEGLRDAGNEHVEALLVAIEEHGNIIVQERW